MINKKMSLFFLTSYPLQNSDFSVSTVKALIKEGESKAMKIDT